MENIFYGIESAEFQSALCFSSSAKLDLLYSGRGLIDCISYDWHRAEISSRAGL